MSDDLLQRAAKALREDADGPGAAGLPKQAILQKIEANRRASAQRWAVATPLVLLLVTSTAIAAATGVLPVAWQKVKQLVAPAEVSPGASAAESTVASPRVRPAASASRRPALPALAAPAVALAAAEPAAGQPALAEPAVAAQAPEPAVVQAEPRDPAPAEPRKARAAPAARAPSSVAPAAVEPEKTKPAQLITPPPAVPAPAAPAEPPAVQDATPDPLQPFRAAQRLQFKEKNWAAALAAWDHYLRQTPHGALAPEARWNRAICLLRLERTAEARQALRPFAQGAEGGYRQAQAQALLQELGEDKP